MSLDWFWDGAGWGTSWRLHTEWECQAFPFPVGAAGLRGAWRSPLPAMVSESSLCWTVLCSWGLAGMGLGVQGIKSSWGEARRRRWGPKGVCLWLESGKWGSTAAILEATCASRRRARLEATQEDPQIVLGRRRTFGILASLGSWKNGFHWRLGNLQGLRLSLSESQLEVLYLRARFSKEYFRLLRDFVKEKTCISTFFLNYCVFILRIASESILVLLL